MEKYFMAAMGGAHGLGNVSIKRLVEFFGSAKVAWSADVSDLFKSGVKKNALEAFIAFRREHPNAPEKLVAYCERHDFGLCSVFDDDYPYPLNEIDTPPMFFYYRGKLQPKADRIAIVGSRENTRYGQNVALELGEELAAAGLTVVSGAARGIDTFAHHGAMKTGRTVAVLGCGIDIGFRSGKRKFLEQIIERGVVLSEFPPQLPPNQGTFPTRNRIIAGLSRGVVVVEAGKGSGALLTSSYAGNYSRDVFVIPGRIYDEKSEGCLNLIRDGAILIKNAQDVLDEYEITSPQTESKSEVKPVKPIILGSAAAKILAAIPCDKFISDEEILMQVDDIAPHELPDIMFALELKGFVEENSGQYKRKLIQAEIIILDGAAAKILEIIPRDKFITDEEILMQVDDIKPNELPAVMFELELKGFVEEDSGRYKLSKMVPW